MRKRTQSRQYALQALYQSELSQAGFLETLKDFWQKQPEDAVVTSEDKKKSSKVSYDPEIKSYTENLVRGVLTHAREIDLLIEKHAKNWKLERMAYVDRNILRLAVYEMMHAEDVPPKVAINEAVELAKLFGDSESSKFVNGILDKIAHQYSSKEDLKPSKK